MSYQNYNEDNITPRRRKTKPQYRLQKLPPIDKNMLIIVIMLIILGIVAIFSASIPEGVDYYNNPLYYPIRHLFFVAAGIFAMVVFSKIHYTKWREWAIPVSFTVIIAIAATLIPGIGKTDFGSSRWLSFGFIQIQPSEFGKFVCILLMSMTLSTSKNLFDKSAWKNYGIIILIMLIVLKQPNMSMLIIMFMTCAGMVFVSGINPSIFIAFLIASVPSIGFLIMNTSYQSDRIIGWLHPESDPQGIGYNIIQSWYAIASGGLLGVGLGNSKQKLYYLPVGYTDFVFSVIAEETGFVGVTVLVILFLLFIHFGFKIAFRCKDLFGRYMAFGIVFNIGFQAFTNMCVASGVFPVTGVTLPLISYGGSSFIAVCAMLGVLFNISRYAVKKQKNEQIGSTTNGKIQTQN